MPCWKAPGFEKGRTARLPHPMATPRKASIFSHLELPLPLSTSSLQQLRKGTQAWWPMTWACGHMGLRGLWPEKRGDSGLWPLRGWGGARGGNEAGGRSEGWGFLQLPPCATRSPADLFSIWPTSPPRSLPCPPHPEMGWKLLGGGS